MQQIQLAMFFVAVAALVVTGCILTRKSRKKLLRETLRPAVPDEHQPGCFGLEEKGAVIGGAAARRPLRKLGRVCDRSRDEARRIVPDIARLPSLLL